MKKIIILLMACIGFTAINTDAQTKKKKHRTTRVVKRVQPAKSAPAPVVSTNTAVSKSISDGTTGVMGKDKIKSNPKNINRNMNTNTGVAVPPADGGN